jgi:hypothetical protein
LKDFAPSCDFTAVFLVEACNLGVLHDQRVFLGKTFKNQTGVGFIQEALI